MATVDGTEDYAPELIEEYLRGWNQLVTAAEGATGGSWGGKGTGKDRLSIACLVADLERAADALPPDWASTRHVFQLQGRRVRHRGRLIDMDHTDLGEVIWMMAHTLGWKP